MFIYEVLLSLVLVYSYYHYYFLNSIRSYASSSRTPYPLLRVLLLLSGHQISRLISIFPFLLRLTYKAHEVSLVISCKRSSLSWTQGNGFCGPTPPLDDRNLSAVTRDVYSDLANYLHGLRTLSPTLAQQPRYSSTTSPHLPQHVAAAHRPVSTGHTVVSMAPSSPESPVSGSRSVSYQQPRSIPLAWLMHKGPCLSMMQMAASCVRMRTLLMSFEDFPAALSWLWMVCAASTARVGNLEEDILHDV